MLILLLNHSGKWLINLKKCVFLNPNSPLDFDKYIILKEFINKVTPPRCDIPFQAIHTTEYVFIFNDSFSFGEIKDAIKSTKSNSAADPDLIDNYVLKIFPDSGINLLLKAFNLMILDGSFPLG